jgi:hypothetical protein
MRLSELRGVLSTLERIANKRGNIDPIVELFHVVDGENYSLTIDQEAINKDPEGQLTSGGSIHLPLSEIKTRGWIVTYFDIKNNREGSIIMQAENGDQACDLFRKHFSTYRLECVTQEE